MVLVRLSGWLKREEMSDGMEARGGSSAVDRVSSPHEVG